MKLNSRMKMYSIPVMALLSASAAYAAYTAYNDAADSVRMAVTGFYVSASADCSSLVTVFEDDNAPSADFTQNLSIGGGEIPDMTVKCTVLRVKDSLKVTVNSNAQGQCAGWTGQDMYNDGVTVQAGFHADDKDGNLLPLGTAAEETIYLFFVEGGSGEVFKHPIHGGGGPLTAFTISGQTTLKFKLVATAAFSGGLGQVTRGNIRDLKGELGNECTFADDTVSFRVEKQ